MDFEPGWYIIKQADDRPCEIRELTTRADLDRVLAVELDLELEARSNAKSQSKSGRSWGPYASPQEAIAKRVGLIRAGQCQPQ